MDEKKKEKVTVRGPEHTYQFQVLDTIVGVGLWHEYLKKIGSNLDDITEGVAKILGTAEDAGDVDSAKVLKKLISGDDVFIKLRKALIEVLDVQSLYELSATFFEGAKIDDAVCDELGMCDLFRRKPHEIYTALIMAMAANYPDYFPFLRMEAVDTEASL